MGDQGAHREALAEVGRGQGTGVSGQVRARVNCKGEGPRRGCGTQLEAHFPPGRQHVGRGRGASGLGIGRRQQGWVPATGGGTRLPQEVWLESLCEETCSQ